MFRFSRTEAAADVPHRHRNTFAREVVATTPRLVAAAADSHFDLLFSLAEGLADPFFVLWVLRVSCGGAPAGRYQSPPLPLLSICEALQPFRDFLSQDGRSQLWLHSADTPATLVWDQHELLYLYGPLDRFQARLVRAGFKPGSVSIDFPHGHHYHAAFDEAEGALAGLFSWRVTDLRPDD
jgi:hypothetical protein